ncbi:uncharacterized protein FOMMEDRAFT_28202 [Fomitiporia mediterranea MF3/22]|uniref:uncharacterized protein n=1 Tax=Fomitiporia mediterranea (strain MF3/22) TaxID=694068 RepID=UPI0004409044|nr:uncharacterized protein FOMMEDRAFT_28202 [Fomitiporia mediterranea MF3/22]EJD04528.1 hypothetical protein FOMMEDRAFT_28202 [Fomitiporia mediterranea MF3/22]
MPTTPNKNSLSRRALRATLRSNSSSTSLASQSTDLTKMVSADYSSASSSSQSHSGYNTTTESDSDGREDEGPDDLDEEWDFHPKAGESVWVKMTVSDREVWYQGQVRGKPRPGTVRGGRQGDFYSVRYGTKTSKLGYFAPLLGDIKPDTRQVRRLLEEEGRDVEL